MTGVPISNSCAGLLGCIEKEQTTPSGGNSMRSQVLHQAAQLGCIILCHADLGFVRADCWLAMGQRCSRTGHKWLLSVLHV